MFGYHSRFLHMCFSFSPYEQSYSVLLDHPWLREGEAPDKPIDSAVLSRLKQFRAMNKLKKLALKVILREKAWFRASIIT